MILFGKLNKSNLILQRSYVIHSESGPEKFKIQKKVGRMGKKNEICNMFDTIGIPV